MLVIEESIMEEIVNTLLQERPENVSVNSSYELVDIGELGPDHQVLDLFKLGSTNWPDEKGVAFLGKSDQFLYVFACFEDSDIYNPATGRNSRTWETGDVMEFFFQAPGHEEYFELHLTPGGATLELRIPSIEKFGKVSFESQFYESGFFSYAEKFNRPDCKGWMGLMEIPFEGLGINNGDIDGARFAVCRYNYNQNMQRPEISSTVLFPSGGFHQPHLWHEIRSS